MLILGLTKTTLLDYPEHVAATIFTGGCNFRCPFCHNALLVTDFDDVFYSEEEIFEHLERRKNVLDGVAVTGGEPLLQKDIERFLYEIKEKGFAVKLDTNGFLPDKMITLVEKGLIDYVAMDIKNSLDAYDATTGTDGRFLEAIEESVAFLKEGKVPYEFRTTVTKDFHTREHFEKIGQWIQGAEKYFLQFFVDSGDLIDSKICGCDEEEMKEFLSTVKTYVPNVRLRGI